MHSPRRQLSSHAANASRFRSKFKRFSELDIRSQLDYACPLIGRSWVVVRRNPSYGKPLLLNVGCESSGKATVGAAISRARLKVRMIESVQHLRLEGESNALTNRERLGDRQVIVEIVGPVEIDKLANGSSCRVRTDVGRVCAASGRAGKVPGVEKAYSSLSGDTIYADSALQLRLRHPVQGYAAIPVTVVVGVRIEGVVSALQQKRRAGLEAENGSDRPSAHNPIQHSVFVQELLSAAKRQVVAAIDVDRVANIEQSWAIG
jgi:hypothetical protein